MKPSLALGLSSFTCTVAYCNCAEETNLCNDCKVECAYTHPFYDLQCDRGFFITADFLYWYGKDTSLVFAQKTKSDRVEEAESFLLLPTFYNFPSKILSFKEEWDPGARVGIGVNSSCDGWDLYANWTWFSNTREEKELLPPVASEVANELLLNPWSNPIFGNDFHFEPFDAAFYGFAPAYTQMCGEWKEQINYIDGEIGRRYLLSPCMSLRPFFGIRGAWNRNRFKILSQLDSTPQGTISTDSVKFKNNFRGVGIIGGFQPCWFVTSFLGVFGNADFALLWSRLKINRTETIGMRLLELDNTPVVIPKATYESCTMQTILDLSIGLRLESNFCCNHFHAALDIGWEQHIWFNHNQRFQFRDGSGGLSRDTDFTELGFISAGFDFVYGDLVFGGPSVKVRIDF